MAAMVSHGSPVFANRMTDKQCNALAPRIPGFAIQVRKKKIDLPVERLGRCRQGGFKLAGGFGFINFFNGGQFPGQAFQR